jgi:hypothetical protein
MTEQTDAIVVVVSEESGQISLVERARIVRNLDQPKLARALASLLRPQTASGFLHTGRTPQRRVRPSVRDFARRARLGATGRSAGRSGKGPQVPPASGTAEGSDGQEKAS